MKWVFKLKSFTKINSKYASKFLSSLDYNRNNNNENKQFYDRDLDKINRKFIDNDAKLKALNEVIKQKNMECQL